MKAKHAAQIRTGLRMAHLQLTGKRRPRLKYQSKLALRAYSRVVTSSGRR